MAAPAPVGSFCAAHPEAAARWVCGRCGAFMCPACERRIRPEAVPMCPGCWELRSRVASLTPKTKSSGTALQTTGLVLGVISLLPLVAIQLVALIVNIVGIVGAKEPPARGARWRSITGLCLTLVGIGITILIAMS